jgi:hypothetical protein
MRNMQKLSISRENLKHYKSNNYDIETLDKTILNNKTEHEVVDVTPICKLLFAVMNFNEENRNIA